MKKQILLVVIGIVLLTGIVVSVRLFRRTEPPQEVVKEIPIESRTNKPLYDFDTAVCPGPTQQMQMNDVYMRGVLEIGQSYSAHMNWYACHPIKKGDLVLYRFSWKFDPVVKRVVGAPGDKIALVLDPHDQGWNLKINDKIIQADKKPYAFGTKTVPPPLANYAKSYSGVIQKDHAVVLSTVPPGESDSGSFGAISLGDIVARVEPLAASSNEAANEVKGE
ncbi:MAG: S26 family signal peptidase [Bdellovibrionaceae bacterium]|nr:S26 family signal peptidase [Pseudobdellovibrionaceae bacterium]